MGNNIEKILTVAKQQIDFFKTRNKYSNFENTGKFEPTYEKNLKLFCINTLQ
jgi:hypothetical protein